MVHFTTLNLATIQAQTLALTRHAIVFVVNRFGIRKVTSIIGQQHFRRINQVSCSKLHIDTVKWVIFAGFLFSLYSRFVNGKRNQHPANY